MNKAGSLLSKKLKKQSTLEKKNLFKGMQGRKNSGHSLSLHPLSQKNCAIFIPFLGGGVIS